MAIDNEKTSLSETSRNSLKLSWRDIRAEGNGLGIIGLMVLVVTVIWLMLS